MKVDCTFEFTKGNLPLSINLTGISLRFPKSCKRREMTDADYLWPHSMALAWKKLSEYQLLLSVPWLVTQCTMLPHEVQGELLPGFNPTTFVWHFVTLMREVANPRSWLNKWYLSWEFKNEKDLDTHLLLRKKLLYLHFPKSIQLWFNFPDPATLSGNHIGIFPDHSRHYGRK